MIWGSGVEEIRRRLPKEIALPRGTDIEYGGLFQIQQESFAGLTQVLLSSILLIFVGAIMVVGIVHENGIPMLDSEKEFTARGFGLKDAIFNAGRRPLRLSS